MCIYFMCNYNCIFQSENYLILYSLSSFNVHEMDFKWLFLFINDLIIT